MEKLWVVGFFLFAFLLAYLLYRNGYLEIKSKGAVGYVGALGNSCGKMHKARLVSCSGSIKRVLKLKENRDYHFILNAAIAKGDLTVKILDSKKNRILTLNHENKEGHILSGQGKRYYLVINYDNTDGTYQLTWK